MNNNIAVWIVLFFVFFAACEQERLDDTRALHPCSGDMRVVFAFLNGGAIRIDIEAQRTLPYYSQEASAELIGLDGSLVVSEQAVGAVIPVSEGRYVIDLDNPLTDEFAYHLSFGHPDFGTFRTAAINIIQPVSIICIDTFSRQGRIVLTGNFSPVSPGLSVSSKLLRYGEGIILNSGGGKLLPLRAAKQPINESFNTTEEYFITEQFTIFDRETRTPSDTIRIDSVQLILYTWGEEAIRFNESIAGTNQRFGDGGESIDNTSWSKVEGGYGLVAGFATDTLTADLR
jgi:hypothetical protein